MVAEVSNLNGDQVRNLTDRDWKILIDRIRDGKCTPFIGAGIYHDLYTVRSRIAEQWAKKYDYPLSNNTDLASVARFLSVEFDAEWVQGALIDELNNFPTPKFDDPNDPYNILATLPLPIYITTNYDDFMIQALKKRQRDVQAEVCRWKTSLMDETSHLADGFNPTEASPSVFHLYGYASNAASLVLTEDDYFQFMINVATDATSTIIPKRIQRAMANASLLLLGYRLDDWDFRVLFHLLASCIKMNTETTHVSVQISPVGNEAGEDVIRKVQNYFGKYFKSRMPKICISWETTQDFVAKLKEKWEASGYGNG